jgi:hypothetical protein
MVKSQTSPVAQNIPRPTTNIPQQPIVNGNPMASNTTIHKHTFDGTVTFKINAPTEIDAKKLQAMVNTERFVEDFYRAIKIKGKETEERPI